MAIAGVDAQIGVTAQPRPCGFVVGHMTVTPLSGVRIVRVGVDAPVRWRS
jgi:hypothetical protein